MAAIRLYFDSCAAAYFQPGSDRELFNQGNATLFCAAMDALLRFRYDFIGPIAELRCKRPMCIQDLGRGVDFLFVAG